MPPATKPPTMVFQQSSCSRRLAAAFRKNMYDPPIAAAVCQRKAAGGGGEVGGRGSSPNVPIVPPVRVNTPRGPMFRFVNVFWTALTPRPRPPKIRVPLVASPIASRRRNGGGECCSICTVRYAVCGGAGCGGAGAGGRAVGRSVVGRWEISAWNWIALTVAAAIASWMPQLRAEWGWKRPATTSSAANGRAR